MQENATKRFTLNTRQMVTLAMLCTIGIVSAFFIEIPLLPAAPHLKYAPAVIPILIGTLLYGPISGIIMTIVVSTIQSMMHGSGGVIGLVMNLASTGILVAIVGIYYSRSSKKLPQMVIAMIVGTIIMVLCMIPMNLIFTPIFLPQVPREAIIGNIIPVIIPFNLLNAGINCLVGGVLYKSLEKILKRQS